MSEETEGQEVKKPRKKIAKAVAEGSDIGKPDAMIVRSQSSVVVKLGAKGGVTWEVKVYADDPAEATKKAIEEHTKLSQQFNN